ncbi:MAG: hypothetical protein ACRD1O_13335, partial [Terriglobia bacterium]
RIIHERAGRRRKGTVLTVAVMGAQQNTYVTRRERLVKTSRSRREMRKWKESAFSAGLKPRPSADANPLMNNAG